MRLSMLLAGLVPAAVVAVGGCTSFSPAPPERATLIAAEPPREEDWPARDVDKVRPLTVAAPTEVHRFRLDGTRAPEEMRAEDLLAAAEPVARVAFDGVMGRGVLRVFEDVAPGKGGERTAGGFAPNARFVSSWYLEHPKRRAYEAKAAAYEETSNRLLSVTRPGLRYTERAVRDIAEEGVGIVLPPAPASAASPRARGLMVYLRGTLTAEEERPLLETMESRGWAIIQVDTVTAFAPVRWGGGVTGAAAPVRTEEEITRAALDIAESVDHALAETAYAAEAALAYCAEHRGDLPTRPVILLGCSTGALALPAVAAGLGERVDAAILVGGGANILDITQRSDAGNWGIALDWGRTIVPVERYTDLLVQYLRCSRLDPYHTAPCLVDKPVLVVHAVFDGIVPASSGLVLYDRLGAPDRLRFSGGHTAMFYFMEDNAPKIATWLDRAMQERARAQREMMRTRPLTPAPELPRPPNLSAGAAR